MALTRQVQRGSFLVPGGSWPGGTSGSLNVGQLSPSTATAGTILRSISFPAVSVDVGTPGTGTPPEGWWQQVCIDWFIYASFTFSPSFPTYGSDSSVLLCGKLYPTLVASPSQPTAYYVRFTGPAGGFESEGQRKAPAGLPIVMNTGMRWDDPAGGMDVGTFPAASVVVRSTDICVFGERI